ncbi:AraC family transcriptional regulator [Maribacter ulvicola]|uniref:Transcriptional regulator, AraC family n=1 Tax=Maribacter ulvicola TaxID=228959 RepID=A0A1N6ZZJ1_9FLAO|nr:helix-turn-helix transcriptional regulator [Maribacter ulvicola]SIR32206.1 transcriptional regulator, AraC family [Maribacter ulvicola]
MKTELIIKDKVKQNTGLKVSRFKQEIRKTAPHRHNGYFEIIFLTKGSGSHTIDTTEYKIQAPVIFNIRKEHIHFWDIKSKPEGFVFIIKKAFIDNCLDKDIKKLVAELSALTCLFPTDTTIVDISNILLQENEEKKVKNRQIIEGLLKALLAKFLESVSPNNSKIECSSIYQKLNLLLSKENELTNKVSHYAKLLNTTPQNLNAVCRKETGKSSAAVISNYIINEAKRLLLYTDLRVGEIADKLDFKDNSHFSKYFKRNVGNTPIEFRKSND